MNTNTDLRSLTSYIRALEYSIDNPPVVIDPQPIITISRQKGGLGTFIARKTADYLTQQSHGKEPWIVIDRSLAQRVVDDHHLSQQISRFLTEEQTATVSDRVEEILGLRPSCGEALEKMTQTILRLAELGRVIFVGRAANIITAKLANAYHVRVIGTEARRIQRIMEAEHLPHVDAQAIVRNVDFNRSHFCLQLLPRER